MEPEPGQITRLVRNDRQKKIRRKRKKRTGSPRKKGRQPNYFQTLAGRTLWVRASRNLVKEHFPELLKGDYIDLPEIPPTKPLPCMFGAEPREFAIIAGKYLQWEKFVRNGRYNRLREYYIAYNLNRKRPKKPNGKPSKFNNIRCVYDGHNFDSLLEKQRYIFLKLQEKYGIIKDLEVHPSYYLGDDVRGYVMVKSQLGAVKSKYKPDFRYKIVATDEEVVEDVKSIVTLEEYAFKVKRGIWEWLYGQELRVVVSPAAKPGSTRY